MSNETWLRWSTPGYAEKRFAEMEDERTRALETNQRRALSTSGESIGSPDDASWMDGLSDREIFLEMTRRNDGIRALRNGLRASSAESADKQ